MDQARRRYLFIFAAIVICFLAVEIKLFHLQIVDHPMIQAAADGIYRTDEDLLAARGRVLTRNGFPLAESIRALDLYADSRWTTGHRDALTTELGALIRADETRVDLRLRLEEEGYRRLLHRPLADGERILELSRKKRAGLLPGIDLERTWLRSYPESSLAAAIVGFVNTEGRGQSGVELAFDDLLSGVGGSRGLLRDAAQRPMYDVDAEVIEPSPGHDVRLTLDLVIQYFAEEALEDVVQQHNPEWCSLVCMDPKTGEILALASRPNYDPNHYGDAPIAHHQNPSVAYQYTPGSTFKPYIMGAALEQMAVDLNETIDCSSFRYGRRVIKDSHPHGDLSPLLIMSKSSNIGMSKIALRLVPDPSHPREAQLAGFRRIRDLLVDLGFGRPTRLGLPLEAPGHLRPVQNWTHQYTLPSIAFGHEISVTPVQMAAAFCAIANDGVYLEPYLVEAVIDSEGRTLPRAPRAMRQVLKPATAEILRDMLVHVVDEGTGTRAAIEGYSVAGKTSTAQWERDKSKYTVSFVGFAPATNPRLLTLVVVDQPRGKEHYGGQVAGPAARHVLEKGLAYLRVPMDRRTSASPR